MACDRHAAERYARTTRSASRRQPAARVAGEGEDECEDHPGQRRSESGSDPHAASYLSRHSLRLRGASSKASQPWSSETSTTTPSNERSASAARTMARASARDAVYFGSFITLPSPYQYTPESSTAIAIGRDPGPIICDEPGHPVFGQANTAFAA